MNNNLSDVFGELAQSDERAFASAPRDKSAVADARKARHRTRALQATGGTFAIGALAVGGMQVLPALSDDSLEAGTSPTAPLSTSPTSTSEASQAPMEASHNVLFDTWGYASNQHETLELLDNTFECGATAPQPTSGRVSATLDEVLIRPETWVDDFTDFDEDSVYTGVDEDGYTLDALIADASLTSTEGETLRADVPATLVVLAQDGEIVAVVAPSRVDPREPVRVIENPAEGKQDNTAIEYGPDPVIADQPATFTTGYSGWGCPAGFGDVDIDSSEPIISYPPASDYLAPGDYEAFLVARVIVSDTTAAEHYLRDQGFDFWNDFTYQEQLDALGLTTSTVDIETEEDGTFEHLLVDVPVPGDYLSDEPMDEVVISQPTTITVP